MAFKANCKIVHLIRNPTETVYNCKSNSKKKSCQIQSYPGRQQHGSRVEMQPVGGVSFGAASKVDCQPVQTWKRPGMPRLRLRLQKAVLAGGKHGEQFGDHQPG